MKKIFLIVGVNFLFLSLQASQIRTLNEVLFELKKQPYTSYDFKKFTQLEKSLLLDNVGLQSMSSADRFLLLSMAYLEATNMDLALTSLTSADVSESQKNSEMPPYLLARQYLEMKEKSIKDPEKFRSWVTVIKRKYGFAIKSENFKISY